MSTLVLEVRITYFMLESIRKSVLKKYKFGKIIESLYVDLANNVNFVP